MLGGNHRFPRPATMPSCRSDSRMTLSVRAAVAPAVKPLAEATRLEIDAGLQGGDFVCISCSLAAISSPACQRPAPLASLAPGDRSPTKGRRRATTIRLRREPSICIAPSTSPRTCCARKGSPRSATFRIADRRGGRRGEIDFDLQFAQRWSSRMLDAGEPVTALAGVHSGCLRAVRARAHPDHRRPEGQEGRHPEPRRGRAPVSGAHGGAASGSIPRRTSTGSPVPTASPWSCSSKGRSMRFSASRPNRRSCAPARSVA